MTDLNPLYFLPVVAVVVCCLVYAFGFKSSSNTLPPSSLALLRDEPKNKQKIKANGVATTNKNKTHGVSNGSVPKPKAVVKPVKRQEVKSPKATPVIPAPVKNLADNDEVEDFNSGDWVTVVSDKAKKEMKKQQKQTDETSPAEGSKKDKKDQKDKKDKKNQEKNKQEKGEKKDSIRTRSVAKQEKIELEEPAKKPIVISLESLKPSDFEDWSVEEPVEGKLQMSKKSQNKKSNKEQNKVQEKLMERQMSREEKSESKNDSVVPEDVPVAKQDKITKDILTQYDAPVVKKETAKKKTDAKKKSVDEGNKQPPVVSETAKKTNAKKESKKEVKKDTSSGDNKKEQKKKQEKPPVVQATLVPEEPVAPKAPSTDVTDGKNIMIVLC